MRRHIVFFFIILWTVLIYYIGLFTRANLKWMCPQVGFESKSTFEGKNILWSGVHWPIGYGAFHNQVKILKCLKHIDTFRFSRKSYRSGFIPETQNNFWRSNGFNFFIGYIFITWCNKNIYVSLFLCICIKFIFVRHKVRRCRMCFKKIEVYVFLKWCELQELLSKLKFEIFKFSKCRPRAHLPHPKVKILCLTVVIFNKNWYVQCM